MRVILDTGVFYRRNAMARLVEETRPIVVPSVVVAERVRQIRKAGGLPEEWLGLLAAWGILIESFGADHAIRASSQSLLLEDDCWRRLARDAFIAAHVRPGDELWTTNPRDFLELGVPAGQVAVLGP